MHPSIIDKYKIRFGRKLMFFDFWPQLVKIADSNIEELDEFLMGWSSAQAITELLLQDIETALTDPKAEIENGSETVLVVIKQIQTTFYPNSGNIFSIPTADFRQIMEAWKKFLL